ncbi:MFS transporter [Actinomadura sp. J1-007]|nr:MFS transporter [Actinomadura sp. J1-007]
MLGAAGALHMRRHPNPVIGFGLFRHRTFAVSVTGVFLYYLVFAAMLLSATLFLSGVWHYSVVRAGLGIAPLPVTCMLLSPFSGRIVARVGGRASAVLGGVALAGGCAWWALAATAHPSYAAAFLPGGVLAGASTALLQPPLFGSAATLPAGSLSLGSAILMMSRQISSALGVAVLTAILGGTAAPSLAGFRTGWTFMLVTALLSALVSLRYRPAPPVAGRTPSGTAGRWADAVSHPRPSDESAPETLAAGRGPCGPSPRPTGVGGDGFPPPQPE